MTDGIISRFREEVEPGDALAIRMKSVSSEWTDTPADVIYSGRVLCCSDTVYPSDAAPICGFRATCRDEVTDDGLKTQHIDKWTHIGECRDRLGVLDWAITTHPPEYNPAVVLTSTTTIVDFISGGLLRGDALLSDDDPAVSAKFVDAAARAQGGL